MRVLPFLALASVLACLPIPGRGPSPSRPSAGTTIDTMVDVGGRRLHLRIRRGSDPVTVLFEAGGAADLSAWADVPERLAVRTGATIVAYDRAGLGSSELGPDSLTPRAEVADIRRALDEVGAPSRTVVVGHSYGAMLALAHAALFAGRVSGLVLVDPMNPRFVARERAFLRGTVPDTTDPQTDRRRVIRRMSRTLSAFSAWLGDREPALAVSMVIVSAGKDWWGTPAVDAAWRRSHRAMAAASSDRQRVVSEGSDHDIPHEDPGIVVSAILGVLTGTAAAP